MFQSYMLGGTHSSLKSGSLDLDLDSTVMSGLLTGREENIQIMADIPDDDEVMYNRGRGLLCYM